MKQKAHPGRRALKTIGNGLHMLERGVAIYHGIRGIGATLGAAAEIAAPLMTIM